MTDPRIANFLDYHRAIGEPDMAVRPSQQAIERRWRGRDRPHPSWAKQLVRQCLLRILPLRRGRLWCRYGRSRARVVQSSPPPDPQGRVMLALILIWSLSVVGLVFLIDAVKCTVLIGLRLDDDRIDWRDVAFSAFNGALALWLAAALFLFPGAFA